MKSGLVTIKDIAKELSISPSTVSRALKDHPDISADTKKAVNALAKKLNYQPNSIALSLRKSRTNTIGVVIPEIVHFFFSTVISGIEDVAYAAGYNVIVSQSNESYEREVTDMKALVASRVDGFLVSLSKETLDYEHLKQIHEKGTPMVFFDRVCEEINTSKVVIDDYNSAFKATEHLIEQGSKHIAHLAGPQNLTIGKDRLQGYLAALKKHQIPVREELIIKSGANSHDEGNAITKELLALVQRPDAIFCNNDMVAIGAMKAVKRAGLSIPEDVAVVGFSDWSVSALVEPSLTSITQPGYEMGETAARLFIEQIERGENYIPQTRVLQTQLVVRESSLRNKS